MNHQRNESGIMSHDELYERERKVNIVQYVMGS